MPLVLRRLIVQCGLGGSCRWGFQWGINLGFLAGYRLERHPLPGALRLIRWGAKGSVAIPDSYAFSPSAHIDWRRGPIRWGRAGRVPGEAHPRVYAFLMPRPADPTVTHHTSADAATLMDELCEVYADAYGAVSGEDVGEKSSAFRARATAALKQANYSLVAAHVRAQLVGFAFGYNLRPESGWWDGLTPEPPSGFTQETGSRTVVLAEIEVRQAWQGKGIGRTVHDVFLSQRTEERATLASNPKATDTHALYERWGWHRIGVVPGNSGAYYRKYVLFVLPLPLAATGR